MINKYLKSNYQNKLNSMLSPRRVEPILVIKLYIYNRLTVSLILCLVPSRLIGPLNRLGTFENFVILFLSFFGKESLDLNYIITLNSQKKIFQKSAIHIYIHVHHYIYSNSLIYLINECIIYVFIHIYIMF